MSLQPEKQVKNYILKDIIASGGMGVVWRAWDLSRKDFVAIKSIASDLIADPNFRNRFLDELHRHARLNHPNIVPMLDVFEAEGQSCLVMKFIEGKSLADLLNSRAQHRLATAEAIPIVQDILGALDYAHRQGIVHRDVKPSNILLDQDNRAHLIDFGIALAVGEERRTRTGQTVGTPFYMSPEQIISPKSIDHLSDVYSVGCVLYEMLTGRPPFLPPPGETGETDFAIKQAHVNEPPVPPRQRVATIPAEVDQLIMWTLAKPPEERIPGCGEFSRLLAQGGPDSDDQVIPSVWKKITTRLGRSLSLGLLYLLLLILIYVLIQLAAR